MIEGFTGRARMTMAHSNMEAQRLGHGFLGPEHILLGLIRQGGGVAVTVLLALGVDPEVIYAEVERLAIQTIKADPQGQSVRPPRAKNVIENAIEEARGLGDRHIGTEHLLLALLREQETIPGRVLTARGVTLGSARQAVRESDRGGESVSVFAPSTPDSGRKRGPFTDRMRQVLALANLEAIRLRSEAVASEHLLLGLLKGNGIGASVLESMGVDLRRLARELESRTLVGPPREMPKELPMSLGAKKVIEHAVEEAFHLQQRQFGTQHLLLGLLSDEGGLARDVLLFLGVTPELARAEVRALRGRSDDSGPAS